MDGAQFKAQVDGQAGRPSCVLARSGRIFRAIAPVGVANGAWHTTSCLRSGGSLTITVDGVARRTIAVPVDLSIVNSVPLRIGGKGVMPNNDQYAGQIDNVFLMIY